MAYGNKLKTNGKQIQYKQRYDTEFNTSFSFHYRHLTCTTDVCVPASCTAVFHAPVNADPLQTVDSESPSEDDNVVQGDTTVPG